MNASKHHFVVYLCSVVTGCANLSPPPLPTCDAPPKGTSTLTQSPPIKYLVSAGPASPLDQAEHSTIQPQPDHGPVITLELAPGDLVSEKLRDSVALAGWTLVWAYPQDIVVEAPHTFRGTVHQITHDLVRALHDAGRSIAVVAHPNRTLRVVYRQ